ncbi:MAG TPA: trypsin-like peptidase domain-containing protein [Solirubrobacteraceae bacterium]|jgi:S1-C subfamily serine protease|nr:trypsin-like peptidase domain-containing protein [Solirubrobacteraceae bacterium]
MLGLALVPAALGVSACSKGSGPGSSSSASSPPPTGTTKVEVLGPVPVKGSFNPTQVYRRDAPGVVTVISVVTGSSGPFGSGKQRALGSGFVISGTGEILTNAHVVTNGSGKSISRAREVYVEFTDSNQVPARIVGYDPSADVALLRVDPRGLTLRPLPLGSSAGVQVGSPVAAIGSPFGEAQSLSTGVISATGRSIDSLNNFQISGALQTDAAINHGNSGGPLVNSAGQVLGINSQIASSSGGGEGVGFAVPVDTVKRSLEQLRRTGQVRYAFLGVSTAGVFPQLARRFGLPVEHGAYVQSVTARGPAKAVGLVAGNHQVTFQAHVFKIGGDIITAVNGRPVRLDTDLGDALANYRPGQTVSLEVWRGHSRQTVSVKLGERPGDVSP